MFIDTSFFYPFLIAVVLDVPSEEVHDTIQYYIDYDTPNTLVLSTFNLLYFALLLFLIIIIQT